MITPLTFIVILLGLFSLCLVYLRFKQNRRQCATEVCLGLLQLIQEVQRHRGLSMTILNGRKEFVEDVAQTEAIMAHSLYALSVQYSERHPVFHSTRWQTVQVHWNSLNKNWRHLDFMTNLYAHNEVVLGLLGILQTIAQNQSSLLGPQRVNVITRWPVIVEHLGMLRGLGMHTLSQELEKSDTSVSLAISDHIQQARQALDLLETRIPDSTIVDATAALLRRISNFEDNGHKTWNSQTYYADITAVIDRWYRIMNMELLGTYKVTGAKSLRLPLSSTAS